MHGGKIFSMEDPDYYWDIESQVWPGERGIVGETDSAEVIVRPKVFMDKREVMGHLINLWYYATKNSEGCNFGRGSSLILFKFFPLFLSIFHYTFNFVLYSKMIFKNRFP